MRITGISSRIEDIPLTRPYTITLRSIDDVQMSFVELTTYDGLTGIGCASPEAMVTGETREACNAALGEDALSWLEGLDPRTLPAICRELGARMPKTPAARAAVDIALHDLLAQHLGVPLVDMLGRAHDTLATSITIGIKPVDETVEEAQEYVGRGFKILKIKLGHSLDEDLARLARVREQIGADIGIRVDPNQGYDADQLNTFVDKTAALGIEFLEQPMAADDIAAMRALPEHVRNRLAADETLLDAGDALTLIEAPRACGIFNIKLMKCGGVYAGGRIADIADTAGIELMWGCMDESIVSISAALHVALASPATRYLDLDGSLDLARDVVDGGFVLENGYMRTMDRPGLGVRRL